MKYKIRYIKITETKVIEMPPGSIPLGRSVSELGDTDWFAYLEPMPEPKDKAIDG